MKYSLLCLYLLSLLLGTTLSQQQPLPNTVGLAASPEALTGMLNNIVLPIVDNIIFKVGSSLPSDCCYKNVGIPGSELSLEGLTIPKESIMSSGKIETGPRGIFVGTNTQFNLTFFLDICEDKNDHCIPILRCKGDSNILFTTDIRMLVNIYPDPNGQPIVVVEDFFFFLDSPVKTGLCDLVRTVVDTFIPLVNNAVNAVAPGVLSSGLTGVLHNIPQTIVLPEPLFDFHWAMTNTTQSNTIGTSLMFDVEVLIASLGGKPGPFAADPSIPSALTVLEGPGGVVLEFSDAIINNIFYSLFTAKNPTFNLEVDGFKVDLLLQSSPVFSFTNNPGLDSTSVLLEAKVILKKSVLRITAHTTITAHFEVVVLPEGKITLQLNPNDLDVIITSTTPPTTNDTKTTITNNIEQAWATNIPKINKKLEEKALPLPHLFDFSHPFISYGTGYAAVGFDVIEGGGMGEEEEKEVVNRLVEVVERVVKGGEEGRSCPNLGESIECKTRVL